MSASNARDNVCQDLDLSGELADLLGHELLVYGSALVVGLLKVSYFAYKYIRPKDNLANREPGAVIEVRMGWLRIVISDLDCACWMAHGSVPSPPNNFSSSASKSSASIMLRPSSRRYVLTSTPMMVVFPSWVAFGKSSGRASFGSSLMPVSPRYVSAGIPNKDGFRFEPWTQAIEARRASKK
jgi:hypothetical protein